MQMRLTPSRRGQLERGRRLPFRDGRGQMRREGPGSCHTRIGEARPTVAAIEFDLRESPGRAVVRRRSSVAGRRAVSARLRWAKSRRLQAYRLEVCGGSRLGAAYRHGRIP